MRFEIADYASADSLFALVLRAIRVRRYDGRFCPG